jgi:tetratricopeptide (TPR) repeat protein
MEKALQYYEQALTLDPNYAPAYSAIADWYLLNSAIEPSKKTYYTKAREAINKAVEIDNNLPEAHAILGLIRWTHEWDWKGAEESFETALNFNPVSSEAHMHYANYLEAVKGNFDKSIAEARKAVELDPLSGNSYRILGEALLGAGQFDQAIEELRYAQEMIPHQPLCYNSLGRAYAKKGMIEEAMRQINKGLELLQKLPILLMSMGQIFALKGEKEKTRAILNELFERSKKEYISPFYIALLYADLEELDQTFEYLNKAYENHDIWLCLIKAPHFESPILYTDSRFIVFLKKMGLEE